MFKNLCQMMFSKLTGKKVRFLTLEIATNFISTFISVYFVMRLELEWKQIEVPDPKYKNIQIAIAVFADDIRGLFAAGLMIAFQWIRVFYILQAIKMFGPLFAILFNLIYELLRFSVLFLMIFVIFWSAGSVIFFNIPEFNDAWKGVPYLISASLGDVDFSVFEYDNSYLEKEYGWLFLILFLLMSNIVLLNFLIAILSNKYTELEHKSKLLYLKNILLIKQVQSENDYYSSLIASFVPLNILIAPFVPFIIFTKSKRLNSALMYVCYSPMVVFGTTLFVILSFAFLPFAYLVLVLNSVKHLYTYIRYVPDKTFKRTAQEITWMFAIILLGVFLLVIYVVIDTVNFIITLFDKNIPTNQHMSNQTQSGSTIIHDKIADIKIDIELLLLLIEAIDK